MKQFKRTDVHKSPSHKLFVQVVPHAIWIDLSNLNASSGNRGFCILSLLKSAQEMQKVAHINGWPNVATSICPCYKWFHTWFIIPYPADHTCPPCIAPRYMVFFLTLMVWEFVAVSGLLAFQEFLCHCQKPSKPGCQPQRWEPISHPIYSNCFSSMPSRQSTNLAPPPAKMPNCNKTWLIEPICWQPVLNVLFIDTWRQIYWLPSYSNITTTIL